MNPTAVVMKVCHALSSISARHSHPDAKIAVGAGSTNCSMSKARTTISQRTKMAMITIQGRALRAACRLSRERLRGLDGPLPVASSPSMSLSRTVVASAYVADLLAQLMNDMAVGSVERYRTPDAR